MIDLNKLKTVAQDLEKSTKLLQSLTWKAVEELPNEKKMEAVEAMGCILGLAKIGVESIKLMGLDE